MSKDTHSRLSDEERHVIEDKGTEAPFSGEYDDFYANGIYSCRRCDTVLYTSKDKFNSGCGWPSFDDIATNTVKQLPDADGRRTEIVCANCDGHLGHVFTGEHKTEKDTRHCVNSLSIRFYSFEKLLEKALAGDERIDVVFVAGGCFWGVEHKLSTVDGVLATAVGYMGGQTENPTYQTVCAGDTGHAETVAVIFGKSQTNMGKVLDAFFSFHDPRQLNKQGPDRGTQYRSALFPTNAAQAVIAKEKVGAIAGAVTSIETDAHFWLAEESHQHYLKKKG